MTDSARWKRIETVLDEVLDLASEQRTARLDVLTAGDAKLREEVERLLAADEATHAGVLDRGLAAVAGRVLGDEAGAAPGERIGPYRVVRLLGRGGMGEVLLADRAEGDFEQRVALKIVRGGLNRSEIVERFRRERRILARLRHPNIAALYDGGVTDDGIPYFAMEYVDGQRITDWCDARTLGVAQRVDLFGSVCRAVEHAHRNLVVHRDIKPGNVFVTSDGAVKLLDFGIGKLLDPDAGEETQATRSFLTPAFAAPEQIRGEGASTSSDVFSLGMLLYVLLTGHHPHGDASRSLEIARAIAEDDAPDPSTRAGRDSTTMSASEIAARRGTEPADLRRRLKGDLDNIVAKALRRDPDERYASARELAEDLERCRRCEPVRARAATARYRMSRFVRRHRVGVAAAMLVFLAAAAGVAGVVWQARVAGRERDRAQAVKDYLIEIFSAADPSFESGRTLTAAELVERGADRISHRFGDEPEIRAEITEVLGSVLTGLALYERADELLEEALREYRRLGDDARAAGALSARAVNASHRGELETAERLQREALAGVRKMHGDGPEAAAALHSLGRILAHAGRSEEAIGVLEEAIAVGGRAGMTPPDLAAYRTSLAGPLLDVGRLEDSEHEYRTALAALPEVSVATGNALAELTRLLNHMGRNEEAEEASRRALQVMREEYGPVGHPDVAHALNSLASILSEKGELEEAEALQREGLDVLRRTLGEDHSFVAGIMNNLAITKQRQGDHAAAADLLEEGIVLMEKALGPSHPRLLPYWCNRADNLRMSGRHGESVEAGRRAVALAYETRGERHFEVSYALLSLGLAQQAAGNAAGAEEAMRAAWDIRTEHLGAGNPRTLDVLMRMCDVLEEDDRAAQAVPLRDRSVADARANLPEARWSLSRALLERAELGLRMGEPPEAIRPLLEESLAIRDDLHGEDSEPSAEVRTVLESLAG